MTRLPRILIAPSLLLGGGVLQAQASLPLRANFGITIPERVEFQVVDDKGQYTGMDFQAKAVHVGLPDTDYAPYEGLDDDVSGKPDPNPIQHFEGFFERAQTYTLRFHPKVAGSFKGEVVLADQHDKSRRIKFVIVAKKDLAIQEYRLDMDPLNADNCHLTKIKH